MAAPVDYHFDDGVAVITMDDGKANALSPAMQAGLNESFDRAAGDGAIVVLAGKTGLFSAGFHLATLQAGGEAASGMLNGGFELMVRVLSHPTPVVTACTGHAMAAGLFLMLCGDYRVAADGDFKLCANEVTLGMTMPRSAIEVCRGRLTPSALGRAIDLAEMFTPADAVAAGLADCVVGADRVVEVAVERARSYAALDRRAHTASKARLREAAIADLRAAMEADADDFANWGAG